MRYVGKTAKDWSRRYNNHLSDRLKTHKANWIKQLRALGLKPIIEPLEILENVTPEVWQEAERFWIESLRQLGCRLTNLTTGGEHGTKPSLESRRKMSEYQRNRPAEINARMAASLRGKRRTPEQKERMRQAALKQTPEKRDSIRNTLTGRKRPAEVCAKMSASKKGWKPTQQWIERQRAAKIGRPLTAEHAAKIGAALKGRFVSEQWRQNIANGLRGRTLPPEVIAKRSATFKANRAAKLAEQQGVLL